MNDWVKIEEQDNQESKTWDYKNLPVGSAIEGVLTEVKTVGEFDSKIYLLEDKEGEKTSVWGCTVLDGRMKHVVIGEEVRIEFIGMGKKATGKKAPYLFEVYHKSQSS